MSAIATPRPLRATALTDRLLAAVPLASIYIWLSAVYAFEAWRRVTPWLFGDELEFTQLARSIAATGHPAERGQPHSADSLYNYLVAPFWRINDVAAAYSAIKYVDVLIMAAVVFPTYLLARTMLSKTPALFAAAAAGAVPALAYSSYLVQEPIAYPYAAFCFLAIAKALLTKSRTWIIVAIVASIVAPVVRGELLVIPATLVLAFLFAVWSSDRTKRWRATWSTGDWIGFVVLVFGAIFLVTAIGSNNSDEIRIVTVGYKHRQIVEGSWAAGSLAIGLGVLPFMAGLAALFRARGEEPSREIRLFRSVATAGVITFALYTAIKAAYLSTQFATRVEERNIMYIAPLLFIGTALVLSRRRVSLVGLAVAGAYTLYLMGYALYHVTQYPYQMWIQLYSDALGFAILQQANRDIGWTPQFAREILIVMTVISVLVLLASRFLRGRALAAVTIAAAVGVVGWNLTGELAASAGTNSLARQAANTLGRPFSWVDDTTHLAPTLYLGEEEHDQNPEWLLEFWNRSITRVSSLDGSVLGPGPSGGPNILRDGALYWTNAPGTLPIQYAYAVEDLPCIDMAGANVKSHVYQAGGGPQTWELVRLARPNRLRSTCYGIYPDGWTEGPDSAYYRFSSPAGWLRVSYSRPENYPIKPSPIHITVGRLQIGKQQPSIGQPVLGHVTKKLDTTIGNLQSKVAWFHVPAGGFAAHVVIDHPFVPDDYNHRGDKRELGAQVTYAFFRTRPHR